MTKVQKPSKEFVKIHVTSVISTVPLRSYENFIAQKKAETDLPTVTHSDLKVRWYDLSLLN